MCYKYIYSIKLFFNNILTYTELHRKSETFKSVVVARRVRILNTHNDVWVVDSQSVNLWSRSRCCVTPTIRRRVCTKMMVRRISYKNELFMLNTQYNSGLRLAITDTNDYIPFCIVSRVPVLMIVLIRYRLLLYHNNNVSFTPQLKQK